MLAIVSRAWKISAGRDRGPAGVVTATVVRPGARSAALIWCSIRLKMSRARRSTVIRRLFFR